jgi:hypothetical protein
MADITKTIEIHEGKINEIDVSKTAFAPWSFSKLKVLQQCPLRFYLQYLLKVKLVDAPPPSLITNVGKAVHLILENVILGKTISESFELAKKEYTDGGIMTVDQWDAQVATTEYNIIAFRTRLDEFEKKFPIKRYIQELRVGIKADYSPTAFFDKEVYFRGVVDFGIQMKAGEGLADLIIIDHKTGAPAKMGIRNFKTQLNGYKVLFHNGVEPIQGAQAGIHFVKDGEVILDSYTTKEEIEGKLTNELEFYLAGSVDKVKELGYFKHIRGPHCKWCDYDADCRDGKLLNAELGTKRFFEIKKID